MNITLRLGDCLEALKEMEDNSVGSILCDPPYDLVGNSRNGSPQPGDQSTPYGRSGPSKSKGFMGKEWDGTGIAFSSALWVQVYRVLKPNGLVKAFGGTRTYHKMAQAMADCGLVGVSLEAWCYGSGFPKSHNISRAIHAEITTGGSAPKNFRKARMGDSYEPTGQEDYRRGRMFSSEIEQDSSITELCEQASPYTGIGTALKPAWEPIVVGRKPTL